MKTNRPKIKVPLEGLDIILDLISLSVLLCIIIYTFITYGDLPQTIAKHFNVNGEADSFGDKIMLWILPVIGIAVFIILYFINKYPQLHNYTVNITEDNALKNYRLSTRMVRFTNLFCQVIFAFIVYAIIQLAKGNDTHLLGVPFLIATLILPIVGVGFMQYFQNKINK